VAGVQCAACTAGPDITLYSSDGKRTPRAPVPSRAADPALGAVRGQRIQGLLDVPGGKLPELDLT